MKELYLEMHGMYMDVENLMIMVVIIKLQKFLKL